MCKKQISDLLAMVADVQDPDELRRLLTSIGDCDGCPNHSGLEDEPMCVQNRLEFVNRMLHSISRKNDTTVKT
jgi:hypothetical protein